MSDEVTVQRRPDGAFDVEVRQGTTTTRHVVTVPDGLADSLGRPDADHGQLVERSFAFLLEREPATSILSRFDLDVIGRYFPDYRAELARRMA